LAVDPNILGKSMNGPGQESKKLRANIEDLGSGDFMQIDCAACSHTALLTPPFLARLGLEPRHRVLDMKDRVRCRRCGVRGWAVVSIKWAKEVR
jgi:hypothetical protein